MTIFIFTLLLLITSVFAGLLGALTGLGGGIVIIPVMVLLLHIDIHYAMGASLISVITTSSGAAAAYLKEGYTNIRIGMYLEIGAIFGAFLGAILVAYISKTSIAILFSLILFISAYLTLKRKEEHETLQPSHYLANRLRLNGSYPTKDGEKCYSVQHAPQALGVMTVAGCLSGMLGIGSGVLKVLAMDQLMRIPYKVATTTSNFMIGITGAVSVGIYFAHGYIDLGIVFPVMIGVAIGSILGAKILLKINHYKLRVIFSIIICLLGVEMLYQALQGEI